MPGAARAEADAVGIGTAHIAAARSTRGRAGRWASCRAHPPAAQARARLVAVAAARRTAGAAIRGDACGARALNRLDRAVASADLVLVRIRAGVDAGAGAAEDVEPRAHHRRAPPGPTIATARLIAVRARERAVTTRRALRGRARRTGAAAPHRRSDLVLAHASQRAVRA